MPNGTYGGERGRKTKVGGKLLLRFPPTRLVVRNQEKSTNLINQLNGEFIMYIFALKI